MKLIDKHIINIETLNVTFDITRQTGVISIFSNDIKSNNIVGQIIPCAVMQYVPNTITDYKTHARVNSNKSE